MTSSKKKHILIVLEKENERYKLVQLGFFKDINAEVIFIENNFDIPFSSFTTWKSSILNKYYSAKNFNSFVQNNKNNNIFRLVVKNILNVELLSLAQSTLRTKTDYYLSVQSDSISYSLHNKVFNELYHNYFCIKDINLNSTEELYNYCKRIICKEFPISEEFVIEALKNNDVFFWSKVYKKVKYLVGILCNTGIINTDTTKDEIWSEACCTLNNSLICGKINPPVNAGVIFGYVIGIVRNKNREYLRTISKDILNIYDNIETYIFAENKSQNYSNLQYVDDVNDQMTLLAQILYDNNHPLHKEFISGLEDKVDILFAHYLNKMPYDEIVLENSDCKTLSREEIERKSAKLRQDVSRVKKILKERFYILQNKYKK